MKKTLTILALAVFLISMMPLAFAEDASVETRTRVKADRTDLVEARAGVIKARGDLREARENYLQEVRDFKELRAQLRTCVGNDSERCLKIKADVKVQSKEHLLRTADKILGLLERLEDRIENSKMENKEELLAEIDASIDEVEAIKVKIEALPADASAEEIRALARELREAWKDTRKTVKVGAAMTINFGVHGVLVRAEKLETRLDKVLERLEADGKDTSVAQEHVDSFKAHVAKARELTNQAEDKFEEARESDDFEAKVKEGHELLVQARAELRFAHQDLKQAVRAIKGIEGGEDTLESETASVEAEAQAEVGTTEDSDDSDDAEENDSDDAEDDDSDDEEVSANTSVDVNVEASEVTVDSDVTGQVTANI